MPVRSTLLRGGLLVPVDPAQPNEFVGDLLIEGDVIAAIGARLDVDTRDVEVVDVSGSIVTPGLVDTHRHTWQSLLRYAGADWTIPDYGGQVFGRFGPQFTADDMHLALRIGLAEALDAGITQLLDWNHGLLSPEHVEAAVRAHRESGMRVVFGVGETAGAWLRTYEPGSEDDAGYLDRVAVVRDAVEGDPLISAAMAVRGPEKSSLDVVRGQWELADRLGLLISVHVGNGPHGSRRSIAQLADADLLRPNVTYIHGNTVGDDEIRMIAESGASASVAPLVEQNMGHGPLAIARFLAAGVTPGLSVDTCVNASGDLFGPMRAALTGSRGQRHADYLKRGEWAPDVGLTVAEVLALGTRHGAAANGLGQSTGSLTVGKQADIVVFGTDRPNMFPVTSGTAAVVAGAHAGNVDSVYVAGACVKRNGVLLGLDLAELRVRAQRRSRELLEH